MDKKEIEEIRLQLPTDEMVFDVADLFKMFGDPTRAKILLALQIKPLYVNELSSILNMSASAISHQLRVLKSCKLIKGVKQGKEVQYSLDDEHVTLILDCGISHVNE